MFWSSGGPEHKEPEGSELSRELGRFRHSRTFGPGSLVSVPVWFWMPNQSRTIPLSVTELGWNPVLIRTHAWFCLVLCRASGTGYHGNHRLKQAHISFSVTRFSCLRVGWVLIRSGGRLSDAVATPLPTCGHALCCGLTPVPVVLTCEHAQTD